MTLTLFISTAFVFRNTSYFTANASTLDASTADSSLLRKASNDVIELAYCVVDFGL